LQTLDKNKLRLLFIDILKGYSLSYYKSNKLYFKHNTSFDSGEIDHLKQEFIEKAKRNGLPTESQKEEYLILENLWSKENNEKINKLKSDISTLKQTKSKLFKSDDINEFNRQIDQKKLELITLAAERKDLLGFTVEDYANKKINEYYMFNSLFKDKDLKDRYFSEQEFDELENKDISEVLEI
jgi:phenylalanyl-tRNA synthetase alpha subunit